MCKQSILALEGGSAHHTKKPGEQGALHRPPDLARGLLVVALRQQQGGEAIGEEAEHHMAFDGLAETDLVMSPRESASRPAVASFGNTL